MNFCKDCLYFVAVTNSHDAECSRYELQYVDPVDGSTTSGTCSTMRNRLTKCGNIGKFFEAKNA